MHIRPVLSSRTTLKTCLPAAERGESSAETGAPTKEFHRSSPQDPGSCMSAAHQVFTSERGFSRTVVDVSPPRRRILLVGVAASSDVAPGAAVRVGEMADRATTCETGDAPIADDVPVAAGASSRASLLRLREALLLETMSRYSLTNHACLIFVTTSSDMSRDCPNGG